jgi:hypothetical protein
LRVIAGDGIGALVSEIPEQQAQLRREEVVAHSRVLSEALAQGTVLPMRFGIVLEGDEEVRQRLLTEHGEQLRSELARLGGKVEYSLRVMYLEETLMREVVREDPEIAQLRETVRDQPEDASYFARIRLGELVAAAVERKRAEDAAAILATLSPCAEDTVVAEVPHERAVMSAAFLLARSRVSAFDAALESAALRQAHRMHFKLTGPLAPHSFVELSAGS